MLKKKLAPHADFQVGKLASKADDFCDYSRRAFEKAGVELTVSMRKQKVKPP